MKYSLFTLILFLSFGQLFAQSITVRGTVNSADDGLGAIGATILVVGTSIGTATDIDGTYEIEVPSKEAVLQFSYTGYQTKEVTVGDQTQIDVQLQIEASLLNEVIVVGYGTQKRSNISGAVSTITAEEITESPALRVEQALQGRTAGVQIAQNSGSPGSPLTVRIRGVGTISDSDPLYIVDGVAVGGLDFLNPNDIETINVLKDAASAAIYGARGANGVVLITTKGGKRNQQGTISYDGYFGMQRNWKTLNLLSAREYAILQNEAHIAAGKVPPAEFANPEVMGEGTDWLEAIFESAPIQNHQLTFAGGSEKSAYTVSGNYFGQEGIVGGDKSGFERITARLNSTHDLKEWFTVGNTLNFTYLQRNGLPENNEFTTPLVRALNMDPVTPIRRADGTFAYSRYADTDIVNPVAAISNAYDTWTTNRLVASVFGELKLMKGLTFRSAYSADMTFAKQEIFRPLFDNGAFPGDTEVPSGEKNETNSVSLANNTWKNWQWENVLTYHINLNETHDFTFTGGTTALENRAEWSGGANTNLPTNNPDDAYISNTIDPITSQSAYQGAGESSLFSYFGRLNYEFQDKYLFTATFRADGSSRFGANNRYGYFPSFSAGWVLSREDFWKMDAVSFMKLRASWGQNGNDKIGDYTFTTIVNIGQNYTFGSDEVITNGSVPLVGSNPDLKWETSTQTNVGLDVELWDGKVNFTADYYLKKTTDMLYNAPIPRIAGFSAPAQNIGDVENQGVELALQYRNREGAVKYSVSGNIAFVQNEVTFLGFGEPTFSGRVQSANANVAKTEVGHPIASFFGYVTDGIFQNQAEIEAHAFQNENTAPGDIRFKDLNGDMVVDVNDQTYIGNPTPDFAYGINADVEYKGFDFSMFWQGTVGNEIYNSTVRYDFTYVNRPVSVLDRWTGEGTSNFEPRVNLLDPNQNARISDRFVEDGTYLRLKNVQLGYSLPDNLLSRVKINKLRFYVSAQNLITITDYSGLDPEIGVIGDPNSSSGRLEIGIDRGFYPQARVFLGGVNLTF